MQDMIPSGTGNSRYLKSVSNFLNLYPTYADFAAALIAGTLPIDFNGINPAGIQQLGTPLSKANMLTDAVAAEIGALVDGAATPEVPNAAFDLIAQAVGAGAKIQTGSYVGTGTYGSGNPCSLTFDFTPKIVFITGTESRYYSTPYIWGGTCFYSYVQGDSRLYQQMVYKNGKTLTWYSNGGNDSYQQNNKDETYLYYAVG